jgi:drug/metabolite transporter (DMT)-like permease
MSLFLILLSLVACPLYSNAFTTTITTGETYHRRSYASRSQCSDSDVYPSQAPLRLQENRKKLNAFGITTVPTSTTTTTLYTSALNKQEQKQKKKKADLSELNSSISSTVEIGSPIIEDLELEVVDDQKQNSLVWKARLLLLLSACLYGSNYTCIKILGDYIPSEIGLGPALRFATAALATVPFVMAQRGSRSADAGAGAISNNNDQTENIAQKSRDGMLSTFNFPTDMNIASFIKTNGVLFAGFEVAVWNTVGYLSQARGLESTPASTCAFICSLAVVVVPILDFLAGKNILKREIAGAILAVVGVAFLEMDGLDIGIDMDFAGIGSASSSIDSISISSSSSDLFQASTATDMTQVLATSPTQDAIGTDLGGLSLSTGTLYCLVQPLAFGMGYWRMEHHTRSYPSEGMKLASSQLFSIAALAIISFAMSAAVVVGEPAAALSTNMPSISDVVGWATNPTVVGAILWTGVITTALTVFIETFAMKTLTAAETTIIYSMEPVFGSIIAAVILGESMGSGGAFGAGMIIGGCLLSSMDFGSMATNDGLSTD